MVKKQQNLNERIKEWLSDTSPSTPTIMDIGPKIRPEARICFLDQHYILAVNTKLKRLDIIDNKDKKTLEIKCESCIESEVKFRYENNVANQIIQLMAAHLENRFIILVKNPKGSYINARKRGIIRTYYDGFITYVSNIYMQNIQQQKEN